MSQRTNTLILTIDGLGARDLGAYGNTWVETPALNRLAAKSLLFEHVLIDSTRPELALASMAVGCHPMGAIDPTRSVIAAAAQQGVATFLFSDVRRPFTNLIPDESFSAARMVDAKCSDVSAADWDQTHCARFFAQLIDFRRELPTPHLLWVHYGGLTACWDAPYAWRERMVDEEDPQPPRWTRPPQAQIRSNDPDQQLQYFQAFGAEIMVLDGCLEPLLEEMEADSHRRMVVTSPRGYPLGEHGVVGFESQMLYSELTSVPLLVTDFAEPVGWRSQALVQPCQVARLVRQTYALDGDEELGQGLSVELEPQNERAVCRAETGIALRTPQWLLIEGKDRVELFVKPDDRWEANEVSSRCREVVEQLTAEKTGLSHDSGRE